MQEKCNSCILRVHNSTELCSVTSVSLQEGFIHKTRIFLVLKAHLSVSEDTQISNTFQVIVLQPIIQALSKLEAVSESLKSQETLIRYYSAWQTAV